MKYVMSDLHGNYDKFLEMLDLIEFKEEDELYILGDIFDRGDNPIDILDYIIANKNIYLLKGNHEQMFIECYEEEFKDIYHWFLNGGRTTYTQMVYKNLDDIYKYIKKLPYIKVVDKFILVHAGLYFPDNYNELTLEEFLEIQEEDICLWTRDNIYNEKQFKDYTIICGHSSVQSINRNSTGKILHANGCIYIDCGLQTVPSNGQLGCLRLDDLEEFYIKNDPIDMLEK